MSKIEDKAIDILDKLEKLTTDYAPEVMDAAVQSVSVSGINEIVGAVGGLLLAYIFWVAFSIWVKQLQKKIEDNPNQDWGVGLLAVIIIRPVIVVIIALGNAHSLFDIWNWVAIFNPELALAHKILGL